MSVRSAVQKRDEAAANGNGEKQSIIPVIEQAIERQHDVLMRLLDQEMPLERFEQITLTAIKGTPGLIQCFETVPGQTSVLAGVMQAASAGLEINSIAKEAWLIPREVSFPVRKDRNGKVTQWGKRWEATLQLDYRGVEKLARRDPNVKQITAGVVREGDLLEYWTGLESDHFRHEIRGSSDRPLTHAYCIVRYHAGGAQVELMDKAAVYKRREVSTGYQADLKKPANKRTNPWFTWEERQWAKTAVHGIKNRLDLAPKLRRAMEFDDRPVAFDANTGEIIDTDIIGATPGGWAELEGGEPPVNQDGAQEAPAEPEATEADPEPTEPARAEPATPAEFQKLIGRRTRQLVDAVQKALPEATGLGTVEDIFADPEGRDTAMGIIESWRK